MREADQRECRALGLEPYEAMALSRERSERSQEIWRDGMLLCEWGWRTDSFLIRSASVWMLSFSPVERRRVHFARESRRLMEALLCSFLTLRCEVHAQHEVAIRWLDWLGFRVESVREINNEVFLVMKKERDDGGA